MLRTDKTKADEASNTKQDEFPSLSNGRDLVVFRGDVEVKNSKLRPGTIGIGLR